MNNKGTNRPIFEEYDTDYMPLKATPTSDRQFLDFNNTFAVYVGSCGNKQSNSYGTALKC
jgi:hypothetical protein